MFNVTVFSLASFSLFTQPKSMLSVLSSYKKTQFSLFLIITEVGNIQLLGWKWSYPGEDKGKEKTLFC